MVASSSEILDKLHAFELEKVGKYTEWELTRALVENDEFVFHIPQELQSGDEVYMISLSLINFECRYIKDRIRCNQILRACF